MSCEAEPVFADGVRTAWQLSASEYENYRVAQDLARLMLNVGEKVGSVGVSHVEDVHVVHRNQGIHYWAEKVKVDFTAFQGDLTPEELSALPTSRSLYDGTPGVDKLKMIDASYSAFRGRNYQPPASQLYKAAVQSGDVAAAVSLAELALVQNPYVNVALIGVNGLAAVFHGYRNWRRAPKRHQQAVRNHGEALIQDYTALCEKMTDPGSGSVWLPTDRLTVSVPAADYVPESLSTLNWRNGSEDTKSWHYYQHTDESAATVGIKPRVIRTFSLGDYSIFIEGEKEGKKGVRPVAGYVKPATVIKHALARSPDTRELWYDDGLYKVASAMAFAAMRIRYGMATEKDREDLLVLAGQSLDLLKYQQERHELERHQQNIINGTSIPSAALL